MVMSLQSKLIQAEKALERQALGIERKVILAYSKSLEEIRGEIAKYYAKYDMTYSEMMKYERLANLEKAIQEELRKLTNTNIKTLKSGLGELYTESFYRTAYAIESTAQAKLGYAMINPNVIERAVLNPLDRITWPVRMREHSAVAVRQIREEITRGLIQGDSYRKMSQRITERVNVSASKAVRIVQTEAHRTQQAGRLDSILHAENKGVIMVKIWTSTLDDRTRDSHQELDGQKVKPDAEFTIRGVSAQCPGGFGVPEEDINCRCSIRAEIEGYEPTVRRARDEEGKGTIIPYANYKDWYENRLVK
jgi:SPP1 gp7 family putative phage head morphogenesis protein